jgi:protein ImuB
MFAALFIPHFAIQAAGRHEDFDAALPCGLVDPELSKAILVQLNPAAAAFGLAPGFSSNQALARCAGLQIKSRSRAAEHAARDILLQTAGAFSPNLESDAPGVCLLELKGLGLRTDEALEKWAARILQQLAACRLEAHIGFAATPDLALLAAQTPRRIHLARDLDAFVAQLPVASLNPPPEILEILARWGITFAGELLALGRGQVADRLGPEALALFEKVSPAATRPLRLVSPPPEFVEQAEFEVEIQTIDPLLFILQRFVEQLARRVEALHLVIAQLDLRLGLASGQRYEKSFQVPDPTARVAVLFRMLHTHLENVRADSPIVALQLAARPSVAVAHQFGLFETTLRQPNQFSETLARLVALCGSDRVGTPVLEKTHRPDAFALAAPRFSEAAVSPPPAAIPEGPALRRYRPAIPARIEFRGERPALVRSAVLNAPAVNVRGPFRASGNWWDRQAWSREEWDIETPGGVLCRIFRTPEGCFIEGVYD